MIARPTIAALAAGLTVMPTLAAARERMPYEHPSVWRWMASAVLVLAGLALLLVGITVLRRRLDNALPHEGGLSNLVWILVAAVGIGFLYFAWGLLP
jgi:hypothetical protein